jgi:DNA-directed RNA polymerase specialized sigma24 family protein
MGYAEANDPSVLRYYERLVFSSAARLAAQGVEMPIEDIQQVLRIKIWRALTTFDAKRIQRADESREGARDRYVFMAVIDQSKDIYNRVRRGELFIEDLVSDQGDNGGGVRRDTFEESHGLFSSEESVYGGVEDEGAPLPSTLTQLERHLVLLLYRDYKQSEAGRMLGLPKYELEKTMRSVREKMADWKPTIDATPGDAGDREFQPPVLA